MTTYKVIMMIVALVAIAITIAGAVSIAAPWFNIIHGLFYFGVMPICTAAALYEARN